MTLNPINICLAVAAFDRYQQASAEYARAVDAGAGLFGAHHDAAIAAADEFSRTVPRTAAGALLHLGRVARVSVPPKDADGVLAPAGIAAEAGRVAELLQADGRTSPVIDRLAALHERCWENLPVRSRAWRSVASALEWAAADRVRRPQPTTKEVPAPEPSETDPVALAHYAWRRFDEELSANYAADRAELDPANLARLDALSLAIADAIPTTLRGALLHLNRVIGNVKHVAAVPSDEVPSANVREWRACRVTAPKIERLIVALASGQMEAGFMPELRAVAAVCDADLPADHAVRRSIASVVRWARHLHAA